MKTSLFLKPSSRYFLNRSSKRLRRSRYGMTGFLTHIPHKHNQRTKKIEGFRLNNDIGLGLSDF